MAGAREIFVSAPVVLNESPWDAWRSIPWKRGWSHRDRTTTKNPARRYTPVEKEQAVRLVRQLRAELGTDHGTVAGRRQLGYGDESVRMGPPGRHRRRQEVRDDDGRGERIKALEQENGAEALQRDLRRASAYFAQAELDRPWK